MGKGKDTYHFSDAIIENMIDPIITKGLKNRDAIKSMIINIFSSTNIETLIEIINKKTKYSEFYKGCYVTLPAPKYWKGNDYEEDILADHGLLAENNKLYGHITSDCSWDKEKFNPFHYQFKVDVLLLKEENGIWTLTTKEEEINGSDLELLGSKEEIKHFKVKSKN
jgi:hypothetical protein